MITGDKQETAINIAVSCRLVRNPDALLRCNAPGSKAAAEARLRELLAAAPDAASGKGGGGGCGDGCGGSGSRDSSEASGSSCGGSGSGSGSEGPCRSVTAVARVVSAAESLVRMQSSQRSR